jgi:predicted phosphodiesterase
MTHLEEGEMKPRANVEEILRSKNITPKELLHLLEAHEKQTKIVRRRTKSRFTIGVIGDTHLCDKASAIDELQFFYDRCKSRGAMEILHAGDIASGLSVYEGQTNDLLCFGVEDHLRYVVKHYPESEGMKTYFISGNHDQNYKKIAGVDFGRMIAEARGDMIYLGMYDAIVQLNGVTIGLHHGVRGIPYAVSYHLQKFVEKIGAGQKPQIYILGHYHTFLYMFYRNIHCFLPGCFQKPNDFSTRLGLPNMIGGFIVDIEVGNDKLNSIIAIRPEFIPFYE